MFQFWYFMTVMLPISQSLARAGRFSATVTETAGLLPRWTKSITGSIGSVTTRPAEQFRPLSRPGQALARSGSSVSVSTWPFCKTLIFIINRLDSYISCKFEIFIRYRQIQSLEIWFLRESTDLGISWKSTETGRGWRDIQQAVMTKPNWNIGSRGENNDTML